MFLNDKPYVWPADTLYADDSGDYGYLWRDRGRGVTSEDRAKEGAEIVRRCFALPLGFTRLPAGLLRYAASRGRATIECHNDLIYREPVWKVRQH